MDFSEQSKAGAFDTLFCNNHIQMLKILLPYMDYRMQKSLAVYIKYLELQYTVDFYRKNPYPLCGCSQEAPFDLSKICSELLPYCTDKERKQLEQIQSLFKGMEMYQEISKAMEMMKEFMPDMGNNSDFGDDNSNSMDMINLLMNMLSPEQKEIFTTSGGINLDN